MIGRVAWAIRGKSVHERRSNDRFRCADGSIAALNGLDVAIRRDYSLIIRA